MIRSPPEARGRGLPVAQLHETMFSRIAELKAEEGASGRRNMLTSDGVHPVTAGHQEMAKGILRAMGFAAKDLAALQREWDTSPQLLVLGGRQVTAGSRTGGWCHMLMDALNTEREMVTPRTVGRKGDTLAQLVTKLEAALDGRIRCMLLVPPLGDMQQQTAPGEYKATALALVKRARKAKMMPMVSTFPMVGSDPESPANAGATAYNTILRQVCEEQGVALVDIASLMRDRFEKNPQERLNLGDERLNHAGGVLMAEAVFAALDGDERQLPALRRSWDHRASYTFRYTETVSFGVNLSAAGGQALNEISDRYHKLADRRILAVGTHMLLTGDADENRQRISFVDANWLTAEPVDAPLKLRSAPGSADEKRRLHAYMRREGVDLETLYRRAFKVGLYALRKEDLLGRGEY